MIDTISTNDDKKRVESNVDNVYNEIAETVKTKRAEDDW